MFECPPVISKYAWAEISISTKSNWQFRLQRGDLGIKLEKSAILGSKAICLKGYNKVFENLFGKNGHSHEDGVQAVKEKM